MRKLDLILYTLNQKYRNQLLTERLKENITHDCLNMYKQSNLEPILGKLDNVLIENNKGDLNIELIISK
jgi:hypothetical protein